MYQPKNYFLAIVSIFKDEKHILKEWIDHYISEGVTHFYMIDNGSVDNYQSTIKSYIDNNTIEIIIDHEKYKQTEHYNKYYLKKIKSECDWVLVVDLDEFVYSRRQFKTTSDYLKSIDPMIGQIYIPWKEFGSSGYIYQPTNAISRFIWRKKYSDQESHTKTIFRPQSIKSMWIHHSFLDNNTRARKEVTSDGAIKNNKTPYFANISENILSQSCLHCNHYYAQSFEWYRQVKIPRGSASGIINNSAKSVKNFNIWNEQSNQIIDDELATKHKLKILVPLFDNGITFYYGCGHYINVTHIVMEQFYDIKNKQITIHKDTYLNKYFGDPCPFIMKFLIVRVKHTLHVYHESERNTITINVP